MFLRSSTTVINCFVFAKGTFFQLQGVALSAFLKKQYFPQTKLNFLGLLGCVHDVSFQQYKWLGIAFFCFSGFFFSFSV